MESKSALKNSDFGDGIMEESEIKVSLEDVRKMLVKFRGATLYPTTIENIMTKMKLEHLQSIPLQEKSEEVK